MADGLSRLVKRGAAHEQQHGVEDGQRQFQFVDGSLRQWIHGLEGEIGRKEASEGHGIRHQEGRQAEHAVVRVLLMPVDGCLLGAVGLQGKGGGHLPLLQRSRPLVAVRSSWSKGTP